MYGYMLPSTGYLKDYVIKMHYPGFVIQYPRAEFDGVIPEFNDDPSFGKMIKEARDWRNLCGVENIASMNSFTNTKEYIQFINMCETKHNDNLAEIGNIIKNNIDDIKLILIAGPSSSGKTTFTNRLKIELLTKGIKPVMISMDDYYVNREETPLGEDGKPDYESIYALNIELFNQQLVELIQGEEVTLPYFDFEEGKSKKGKTVKLGKNQPILIEGIHALNEMVTSLIPKHQKFKIFISPHPQLNIDDHNPIMSTDLRLLRRIVRDARTRNTSPSRTFSLWSNVRKGEFKWIYPWQKEADYVFNTSLTYEIMIMKKYALPALLSIKSTDEYYIQANRLIKFLKYVKDVDDKYVPCNSILREFIGESCFYD
jgi:uridine kinase